MYQKINKFGLIGAIGISVVLLLISLFVYNATTYIKTDDGKWQDLEVYQASKAKEKATFKAAQERLAIAKERDLASRGIKKKARTKAEIQAEKGYKLALEEKAKQEELRALYEADKVGETSVLLGSSYFLLWVAIGVAVLFPFGFAIYNLAVYKHWKPVAWFGGGAVILVVIFLIGKGMAPDMLSEQQISDGVSVDELVNAGALITTTWVLLFVAIAGIIVNEITKAFK